MGLKNVSCHMIEMFLRNYSQQNSFMLHLSYFFVYFPVGLEEQNGTTDLHNSWCWSIFFKWFLLSFTVYLSFIPNCRVCRFLNNKNIFMLLTYRNMACIILWSFFFFPPRKMLKLLIFSSNTLISWSVIRNINYCIYSFFHNRDTEHKFS